MSIADYIKDDLTFRLQISRELPSQLTLDSLAELYNVSFTPVRTAVAELIDQGLLIKGANRRLIAPSLAKVSVEPEQVVLPQPPKDPFDTIAQDLIQLSLEGKSIYLREEVTAEKYGVSRSMIRNILHRLAGEGILDHIPRRGWKLRPFRHQDLQAYVEVRESLEITALNLSIPRLDQERLRAILKLNEPAVPAPESILVDESLHSYLIEVSGNPYIREFFERQGRYYRLLFQWEDQDAATALETMHQHRQVLAALIEKDWTSARELLSSHILNNHPILSSIDGAPK